MRSLSPRTACPTRVPVAMLLLGGARLVWASTNSSTATDNSGANEIGVDVNLLFSTPEGRRWLGDLEVAPLVAACVAMVVGVVFCIAGARVLRTAALVCAFFDGAFGTAAVLAKVLDHAEWEGVVSWTCFFLGGIFCCLLVVAIERADVLCIGVTAGLLVAFTCLTTFGYLISPNHPDVVQYVFLVFFGVGVGLLTLWTQPQSVIPATSWIGSNIATWGIGYFIGDYPNATTIDKFRRASDGTYELPSAWWGYLAGAMVLFVLGVCIQAHASRSKRKAVRRVRQSSRVSAALTEVESTQDENEQRCGRYASVQTPTAPRSSSSRPKPNRGLSLIV